MRAHKMYVNISNAWLLNYGLYGNAPVPGTDRGRPDDSTQPTFGKYTRGCGRQNL